MNESRFADLIEKMERLPSVHFDLRHWMHNKVDINKSCPQMQDDLRRIGTEMTPGHCGTTGCVIGFAPVWYPNSFKYRGNVVVSVTSGVWDYEAMAEFLEISYAESEFLFSTLHYDGERSPAKETVLERMKFFYDYKCVCGTN